MFQSTDPATGRTALSVTLTPRRTGALLVLAGLAHLTLPDCLLRTAAVGYASLLDVEFDPGDGATRRVRTLGVAMVAVGAHLLYHGGILPASE